MISKRQHNLRANSHVRVLGQCPTDYRACVQQCQLRNTKSAHTVSMRNHNMEKDMHPHLWQPLPLPHRPQVHSAQCLEGEGPRGKGGFKTRVVIKSDDNPRLSPPCVNCYCDNRQHRCTSLEWHPPECDQIDVIRQDDFLERTCRWGTPGQNGGGAKGSVATQWVECKCKQFEMASSYEKPKRNSCTRFCPHRLARIQR